MKQLKKTLIAALTAISLVGAADKVNAQVISNNLYGQNAWMPHAIGDVNNCIEAPCVFYGKLDQHWPEIKDSKTRVVRYGGIAVDKNMPTNSQYIAIIDSIRANGMEPIIEVPFCNWRYTAAQAAQIVQYINVTKQRNIKYWIIANEPDYVYPYTTSTQVANYFKPFASAMKAVDPNILIIGPETAWFNQNILVGLTTPNGPDDITGKDAAGHYYVDIISFHHYGFNGTQTRPQVISKLTSTNGFEDNLTLLNTRLAACNTAHNRSGSAKLKTAVTEANVGYQNDPGDNLYGVGANSFLGGQYIAEMFGIGMKKGVEFINMWSVIEGSDIASNCGFLDQLTTNKKPSFYHFKMVAENFKGNYANGTCNNANVRTFGSKDGQYVQVMIMNEDYATLNYTVRLNTTSVTGTSALKINIDAGLATQYNGTIQGQSSMILTFDLAGNIVKKTEYTIANAVANQAPVVTNYNITTGVGEPNITDLGVFEVKNVFPNPAIGKFTLQVNRGNNPAKDYQVQIFNIVGQEVMNKKLTFLTGKEEIELNPSLAAGEYFIKIREGEKDHYVTKKIMVQK